MDLVGTSVGGLVALTLAAQQADRIRTLSLFEPAAPSLVGDQPALATWRAMVSHYRDDITEEQLDQFIRTSGIPYATTPQEHPRWPIWLRHRNSLLSLPFTSAHPLDEERLREMKRPVAVFRSDATSPVNAAVTAALARLFTDTRVINVPGGHAAPLLHPDEFATSLLTFLDAA